MNNEPKLKPCPGCGGEASANGVQRWSSNPDHCWSDGTTVLEAFSCNCLDCNWTNKGCFGGFQTRQQAIDHWNTRPLETEMYEALKAVSEVLESYQCACNCGGGFSDFGKCQDAQCALDSSNAALAKADGK